MTPFSVVAYRVQLTFEARKVCFDIQGLVLPKTSSYPYGLHGSQWMCICQGLPRLLALSYEGQSQDIITCFVLKHYLSNTPYG